MEQRDVYSLSIIEKLVEHNISKFLEQCSTAYVTGSA